MEFLHNIGSVARYEAKTLRRSWFFRLFSIGSLLIFTFMNIGVFIGDEDWALVSIPSSLPLINLYLLNIGQALVVIFLASDFLKRDKKVDTSEVLYTRSISNLEYITGKTIGILRLFLGLNIIVLMIGLLINIISKSMTVDFRSYIEYLLIIPLPTILFSLGLSFMLMSLLKNQAVTFLILLGIAALDIFWLFHRFGSVFDYMAFGLPVFKSTVVGFDNFSQILNQRLIYFFLGLSLVFSTVLLFKRLPQSKTHTALSLIFMVLFLAGAIICSYNTVISYINNSNEKQSVIETNRLFEKEEFVSLTDASLEFIQHSNTFEASAELKFVNSSINPVGKLLFSLNPRLKVSRITEGEKQVEFSQTGHIIQIKRKEPLMPEESDSLKIWYKGSISESFCFPDYTGNLKETPYTIAMLRVNRRQAFVTPQYVLLTPETHWYPVAALNYYPSNPARVKIDYTRYTLRVKTRGNLEAISQGKKQTENGFSVFRSDHPLSGITLAIGNYKSDTLTVDSVNYITNYFDGHDYYKKDLSLLKDTLSFLVSGIMRELESGFSTKYPFSELNLVEVPVQFSSYPKMSTQTRAELQPSMVLLPEKLSTLNNAGFGKRFTRQKKRMERNNQVVTDKELQVRVFNDFIRNTFISGEDFRWVKGVPVNEPIRYRLGPSFYFFKNNFYSLEYPVINAVFESHLQKQVDPQRNGFMDFTGGLSDNDKANLILRTNSFREILSQNPKGDTLRVILTVKGDYLFNLLRAKAGIEEFRDWFSAYLEKNKFRSVDIMTFNRDIQQRFGFEFYSWLNDWFNNKQQPGFIINNVLANEIVVNDKTRYLVSFIASNPEPVAGIFNIAFRTGGPGTGGEIAVGYSGGPVRGNFTISMQGRGMEASDISKIILLGPGEAKKISLILDSEPREMMINTLFSQNIPGEILIPIDEIKKTRSRINLSEGETILSVMPPYSWSGEIIVDNEDPGFDAGTRVTQNRLKKILGVRKRNRLEYDNINMFWAPEYWQPVVLSSYYGKYIRSALYTRVSREEKLLTWKTGIDSPGYYDIYCYIGKSGKRLTVASGGAPPPPGQEGETDNVFQDMRYRIYHDEGVDEITIDYDSADPGWNMLGRYYISADTARVELNNQSTGKMAIGDAIKWVKAN